jgi:hypothetical protein
VYSRGVSQEHGALGDASEAQEVRSVHSMQRSSVQSAPSTSPSPQHVPSLSSAPLAQHTPSLSIIVCKREAPMLSNTGSAAPL